MSSLLSIAQKFLQQFADTLENTYDWCEVEYQGTMLTLNCPVPPSLSLSAASFVIHWHEPSQQLWLSSPLSGAWTFSYSIAPHWYCSKRQQSLTDLITAELALLKTP